VISLAAVGFGSDVRAAFQAVLKRRPDFLSMGFRQRPGFHRLARILRNPDLILI
jgi:hypothetical protein